MLEQKAAYFRLECISPGVVGDRNVFPPVFETSSAIADGSYDDNFLLENVQFDLKSFTPKVVITYIDPTHRILNTHVEKSSLDYQLSSIDSVYKCECGYKDYDDDSNEQLFKIDKLKLNNVTVEYISDSGFIKVEMTLLPLVPFILNKIKLDYLPGFKTKLRKHFGLDPTAANINIDISRDKTGRIKHYTVDDENFEVSDTNGLSFRSIFEMIFGKLNADGTMNSTGVDIHELKRCTANIFQLEKKIERDKNIEIVKSSAFKNIVKTIYEIEDMMFFEPFEMDKIQITGKDVSYDNVSRIIEKIDNIYKTSTPTNAFPANGDIHALNTIRNPEPFFSFFNDSFEKFSNDKSDFYLRNSGNYVPLSHDFSTGTKSYTSICGAGHTQEGKHGPKIQYNNKRNKMQIPRLRYEFENFPFNLCSYNLDDEDTKFVPKDYIVHIEKFAKWYSKPEEFSQVRKYAASKTFAINNFLGSLCGQHFDDVPSPWYHWTPFKPGSAGFTLRRAYAGTSRNYTISNMYNMKELFLSFRDRMIKLWGAQNSSADDKLFKLFELYYYKNDNFDFMKEPGGKDGHQWLTVSTSEWEDMKDDDTGDVIENDIENVRFVSHPDHDSYSEFQFHLFSKENFSLEQYKGKNGHFSFNDGSIHMLLKNQINIAYDMLANVNTTSGTTSGTTTSYNIDNSLFKKLERECTVLLRTIKRIDAKHEEIFGILSGVDADDLPQLSDIAFGSYNDTAGSTYSIDEVMNDGIDFYGPILDYLDDAYSDLTVWQFLERLMSKNGFVMMSYPYCKAGFSITWPNIKNDKEGFNPTNVTHENFSENSNKLGKLKASVGFMKTLGEIKVRNKDTDYIVEDMSFAINESGNIMSSRAIDAIAERDGDETEANTSMHKLWNGSSYTTTFKVTGEPMWKPADTFTVNNVGLWSGKYFIESIDIALEGSVIKSTVEAHKITAEEEK
jgi:hypothetical protein